MSVKSVQSVQRSSSFYQKGSGVRSTSSVYGGAGGSGTRVSAWFTLPGIQGGSFFDRTSVFRSNLGVGLHYDEQATMQNLNDRLASYLEKVRTLEKANAELEVKIKESYGQRIIVSEDYSQYHVTIEGLFTKISMASLENTRVSLDIENARLAAEDFKMKYETELAMHQAVMADNTNLKGVLDRLTISRSDLEMRIEGLREEMAFLRKDHLEEMAVLREEVKKHLVIVEVDAPAPEDLARILEEMRAQYEATIVKNTRDIELWYNTKMKELNPNGCNWNIELDKLRIQLSETRRSMQKLEIELQSSFSLNAALKVSLQEIQSRFSLQLGQFQSIIRVLEADVSQVRVDIERQSSEYKMLLDIKTRLELEIAEYRRLLDGEVLQLSIQKPVEIVICKKEPQMTKRTRTIEEVIVDGKVISREEDVEEEKLLARE
ncbi:keratin, type I cytoskeletal 19-like isoform X2 [Alosa pseudoharengus]|uniref:keratin, type I cytoskeletal 19-like isoform X2 n=1 Tax=Alosa pseudoharengus TaxID=34774 RepID=UPI003F8C18BE